MFAMEKLTRMYLNDGSALVLVKQQMVAIAVKTIPPILVTKQIKLRHSKVHVISSSEECYSVHKSTIYILSYLIGTKSRGY